MIACNSPPVHLTYCLNIHPGESWAENLHAIRTHALAVRDRVAASGRFGLGLRLSQQAADELRQPGRLDEFREFLDRQNLYVFTVNGFPQGAFHGRAVKADVYRPDWRTTERRDYTFMLADILSELLPEGVPGSISTVPGSYRDWIRDDADVDRMSLRLAEVATHLARLRRKRGCEIALALEPEPDCFLETAGEAADFLTGPARQVGREYLKLNFGMDQDAADSLLARHLGVCIDAAHEAVAFGDLAESICSLTSSGVTLAKVQLSAALECEGAAAADRLGAFCDETYLHQVKTRSPAGVIASHRDLPAAMDSPTSSQGRWRVHFHVPLHWDGDKDLHSTRDEIAAGTADLLRSGVCPHLEIETYTFDVLPRDMRSLRVEESIAREYEWVLGRILNSG